MRGVLGEAGYALVTVCSPYGYVLVHMLTIYPFLRRQLLGRVAAELVARCYAGKKGVLYCQSRTSPMLPERERLLKTNGYCDTGFRFRWSRRRCICAPARARRTSRRWRSCCCGICTAIC